MAGSAADGTEWAATGRSAAGIWTSGRAATAVGAPGGGGAAPAPVAITDGGRAYLDERREEAEGLLAGLDERGGARTRSDRAPVARAMANLHLALRNALGVEDEARQDAIVAILDEAARQVERAR